MLLLTFVLWVFPTKPWRPRSGSRWRSERCSEYPDIAFLQKKEGDKKIIWAILNCKTRLKFNTPKVLKKFIFMIHYLTNRIVALLDLVRLLRYHEHDATPQNAFEKLSVLCRWSFRKFRNCRKCSTRATCKASRGSACRPIQAEDFSGCTECHPRHPKIKNKKFFRRCYSIKIYGMYLEGINDFFSV